LVINKNCTEMHVQQNINKFIQEVSIAAVGDSFKEQITQYSGKTANYTHALLIKLSIGSVESISVN
jgi:hypothetical protein